jgi:hypothetical protein
MTRRRIIAGGGVAKRRAVIVTGWPSFVVGSVRSAKRSLLGHAAVRTWRDLHRLIYAGDSKGFDFHLLLISIVCAIPGVVLAFLLGYFVRLGTNPKTNWILPSIALGAGAAIVTRTVVNKVQTERKEAQQQKVFEARKAAETGSIYFEDVVNDLGEDKMSFLSEMVSPDPKPEEEE